MFAIDRLAAVRSRASVLSPGHWFRPVVDAPLPRVAVSQQGATQAIGTGAVAARRAQRGLTEGGDNCHIPIDVDVERRVGHGELNIGRLPSDSLGHRDEGSAAR